MTKWSTLALLAAAPTMIVMPAFGQAGYQSTVEAQPIYEQPLTPSDIRGVQERLRSLGFYRGDLDGAWGGRTETALEHFQESRGLQVTGDLNPATAGALGIDMNALLAEASAAPPPASAAQPLAPDVVRRIQWRLRQMGFYGGERDGVWGPSTEAALERFQEKRGLRADGQPTPATVAALGLNPNDLAARQ